MALGSAAARGLAAARARKSRRAITGSVWHIGGRGTADADSSHRCEEPLLANTRHANDASQSASREWSGTVDRDGNGVRMAIFHHHVMATLHPVESKAEFGQCSDRVLARGRRVRVHQTIPT